jgi:hypothetical protein
MAQSDSIAALAAALCEAQFAMDGAKKESTNPHFKSKYADLTSVWEAIRAPLHANGLAVVQSPEPCESGIQLRTVLMHKSGEWIDGVLLIPAAQMSPQGFGSAMSYARRYALSAILGVVADDDDGNAASQPQGNGATYQQQPRQQAPRPAQQASQPQSADRRDLMDRAMTLYGVMKEQGLKYKGKMFKDMDLAELQQAITTMNRQLDEVAEPLETAGGPNG